MARKKNVAPVVEEQKVGVVVVVDMPETNELQIENTVPQFGEATDIPLTPAPEAPATDATNVAVGDEVEAMIEEINAATETPEDDNKPAADTKPAAVPKSFNHVLPTASFNWLKGRTRPEIMMEIIDEIRKGVADGTIVRGENGFVPHEVTMEIVADYEESHGFGSAGSPLDRDAWNFFGRSPFRGWVTYRVLGEVLGKKGGESITLVELKKALEKMEVREDGPEMTCLWCNKAFQPVAGRVFKDGYPLVSKFGDPVNFGAFDEKTDGSEEVYACHPHCQQEARKRKIEEAKAKNDKPKLPSFKPLVEVEARRQERERELERERQEKKRQEAEANRKAGVLSSIGGGNVGRILRDAAARSGRQDSRDRNRHDHNKDRRWK